MSCTIYKSRFALLLAVLAALTLHTSALAWTWQYSPDFTGAGGLTFQGNASIVNDPPITGTQNWLRLTWSSSSQMGSAWRTAKEYADGGFTTEFDTEISCVTNGGADGIAFIVQNTGTTVNCGEQGPNSNAVTVKLDTYQNTGEVSANFVQLRAAGAAVATTDLNPLGINLSDGLPHKVKIEYLSTGVWNVWIDGAVVLANVSAPLGTYGAVDAGGSAWVGFSARTGGAYENHDIIDWSYGPVPLERLDVAMVGDYASSGDLAPIQSRVAVVYPNADASKQPNAIEVATDCNIGPGYTDFSAMDQLVNYAAAQHLKLFLRVKPHVTGSYTLELLRDTTLNSNLTKNATAPSFFDSAYQSDLIAYYGAVAAHYLGNPTVVGIGVAAGPSGEAQYNIDGTYMGDFSTPAWNDYASWMSGLGITVTAWPAMPAFVAQNTRLSYNDRNYYLWAYWRVKRLNEILGNCAAAVASANPNVTVYTFSYMESAPPAGYGPGFIGDNAYFDWFYGNISLDHGYFWPRNQDRSRPETLGGASKIVAGEFDLISAYTDPIHSEAYVRYSYLMNMQPRPFMPVWWNASTVGGWSEGFWTQYSDAQAREMTRLVSANMYLYGSTNVADVAVIVPNAAGMGTMAGTGPWQSDEFKISHTDIVRQLSAIGSNFDLMPEDTVTAAKLSRYKLVVCTTPALYPWVRSALNGCTANVLIMGWSGMIMAAGPTDLSYSSSWFNTTGSWWPTHGYTVQRKPRITFTSDALLPASLQGQTKQYGTRSKNVSYVKALQGTVVARDDQSSTVFSYRDSNGRRYYHFGLPLYASGEGYLLSDSDFRAILTNILAQSGCTAYGDLGPLRLFESSTYLLVENPRGTSGSLDAPAGDYSGTLPNLLKHMPQPQYLDGSGRIIVNVPAGKSILIPLVN